MKRTLYLMLMICVIMLSVSCQKTAESAPTEITIKGEVYGTDLTELSLMNLSLTNSDIEPLQYMTNLTNLNIGYNEISDITALSGLTNLENLFLAANPVSDINALSGLVNLTTLNLESTQVGDISALGGLTSLTMLHLTGSPPISDISVLCRLFNLEQLDVGKNQISEAQKEELLAALPDIWITEGY